MTSDELVKLQHLSLKLHTLYLEKRLIMFIFSIENSPGSMEGSSSRQMTPELENKALSGKYMQSKGHTEPYKTALKTYKRYVVGSMVTDTHTHTYTHTQNDHRNPCACAKG